MAPPSTRIPAPLRRGCRSRPGAEVAPANDAEDGEEAGRSRSRRPVTKTRARARRRKRPRRHREVQRAQAAEGAPAPAAASEPKRFAWAPVNGAVGYRFELFRGDKQVLDVRTTTPGYELPARWRHEGRDRDPHEGRLPLVRLAVRPSGPAAVAVVQARLTVP